MRQISHLLVAALATLAAMPVSAGECRGSIYMTFDTGDMSQAETIARVLREEQVPATFFLANERTFRGDRALEPAWGAYWKSLAADGHHFGSHTWSHVYVRGDVEGGKVRAVDGAGKAITFTRAAYCTELNRVDEAFHRDTGRHLSGMWRAPGWRTTYQSLRFAASCGYPVHVGVSDAGYLRDDLPSETTSNQAMLERALRDLRRGDIVSMHLGMYSRHEPGALILQPLIRGLRARGFCFEPLAAPQR